MKKNMLKTNIIPVLCLWTTFFTTGDSPPGSDCPSEGQPITVDEGDTASLQFNTKNVTKLKETDPDLKIYNISFKDLFNRGVPEKSVQPDKYSLNVTDLERGVIHFSIKNATPSDNGMYQIYSLTLKRCRNYNVTVRPRSSPGSRDKSNQIPTIGPPEMSDPTYQTVFNKTETLSPGEVVGIALGVGSSIIVLIVLAIVALIRWKRNRKKKQTPPVNGHPPQREDNLPLNPLAEGAAA